MNLRSWLKDLPSTDPAFAPLQRASEICDPAEWPVLFQAHRQAMFDATWGQSLAVLDARAHVLRVHAAETEDHGDELEALGYALGVTAVRVAVREHDQADMGIAS